MSARPCIILHGHQLTGAHMADFEEALRHRLGPAAAGWAFLRPTFDYRAPFPEAAEEVRRQIGSPGAPAVFVAYSMGGLVARWLIAEGHPCHALFTVSAPHGGVPRWAEVMRLAGHRSPASLRRGSPELRHLAEHPRDREARSRYHLYGVVYRCAGRVIENDGFLSYATQVARDLDPPPGSRQRIELSLRERERLLVPLVAVHGRLCHHPRAVRPLLDHAAQVMAGTRTAHGTGEFLRHRLAA